MYSLDINDSTLKEVSYKNNIHNLDITGNYLPVQYPTKNSELSGTGFNIMSINKIFIATNDYTTGDSYSIFNKTLSLLNKDIVIKQGDYIKANIDFTDMSIKLTNLSRLSYIPKVTISDIEFSHNKQIVGDGTQTELLELKIKCNENTDIFINSSTYVDMSGKGEVYTYLWCDEISTTEPLSSVLFTSNIPKRTSVQNGYCIKDAKKNNSYAIRLTSSYTPLEEVEGSANECILIDASTNLFINGHNIELDYPCYEDTFYYEEHDNHIELMYLKSHPKTFTIPTVINNKPVTTINRIMFSRIIIDSINLGNITTIEEGAFYKSDIRSIVIPDTITTIPAYCFYSCTNLEEVILEGNVSVEDYAFANCNSVGTIDTTKVVSYKETSFLNSSIKITT